MTLDELAAVKERSMSREIDALVLVRESDVRELINAAKYVGKNSADASDTVHVKKSAWFRMNDAVAELRKNCQPAALTARDAEAAAKLARVEAALVKWQHEAEGLREVLRGLYDAVRGGDKTAGVTMDDALEDAKAALDAAGGAG